MPVYEMNDRTRELLEQLKAASDQNTEATQAAAEHARTHPHDTHGVMRLFSVATAASDRMQQILQELKPYQIG